MRQHLIEKSLVPPGGFRAKCPHCGLVIKAPTWNDFKAWISDHNTANGHEEWDYETKLCESLPPGSCKFENGAQGIGVDCRVRGDDLKAAMQSIGKLFWEHLTGEEVFVSQQEAEQRADTCARCSMNVHVEGCQGCKAIADASEIIGKIRGQRTTSHDQVLQQCCICHCSLKTIVWIRKDILQAGMTETQVEQTRIAAPHCWKLLP